MTTTDATRTGPRRAVAGAGRLATVVRWTGWTLIGAGVLILLYVVYLLLFTNVQTARAQDQMLERWQVEVGAVTPELPGERPAAEASTPARPEAEEAVDPGDAYAAMWFERPGSEEPPVREGPLFLVEGVSLDVLKRGPGHYPETADPGGDGNFAVAGHRTTYGAPFYNLDDLREGDQIHVMDRQRRRWTYVVRRTEIVQPDETWVIGDDPLGTGRPTLTLTTCNPRFSAAERLIVFAELEDA